MICLILSFQDSCLISKLTYKNSLFDSSTLLVNICFLLTALYYFIDLYFILSSEIVVQHFLLVGLVFLMVLIVELPLILVKTLFILVLELLLLLSWIVSSYFVKKMANHYSICIHKNKNKLNVQTFFNAKIFVFFLYFWTLTAVYQEDFLHIS